MPAELDTIAAVVRRADGFLIVTAEYDHDIPPALENMLNHFLEDWRWRPSAIACYSEDDFAGVRVVTPLRAILVGLGIPSIRSVMAVTRVQNAFAIDGTPKELSWEHRAAEFLGEFEWYAEALKAARAKGLPC